MTDRLEKIKALRFTDLTRSDAEWLIETIERLVRQKGQAWDLADKYGMRELELVAEVERLRGLLGRLEWADRLKDNEPACPGCGNAHSEGHVLHCWLAAELARNANDPPEGSQP